MGEEELERRREFVRQRALAKRDQEELLAREEERESGSEESESEYEEYTGKLGAETSPGCRDDP